MISQINEDHKYFKLLKKNFLQRKEKIIRVRLLIIHMTSMSEDTKEMLEALKKEIKLKTGKELTEEELLKKCIQFIYHHSNVLFEDKFQSSALTKEKIDKIISNARDDPLYDEDKSDDELIYGI